MQPEANPVTMLSAKMEKLRREKKTATEFQKRKHDDWNDNYELYRGKVRTNRLTQRQPANIPLMKETVKTLLSRVDDPPTVTMKEKSGDLQKQVVFQEMWNTQFRDGKFEWKDLQDKKNVFLYGLGSRELNLCDTGVDIHMLDTFDILYDPLMDPINIESARFIIRQNIFRSIKEILADDRYTEKGKEDLKTWATTTSGMVQSAKNKEEYDKRQDRLKAMGVQQDQILNFAGGDVVVNLTQHCTLEWENDEWVKHVVVYGQDAVELMDDSMMEAMGVDFWPYVMWMEDPETNDVYPDGVCDLVRTPNKLINIWFSQQIENRTLQNFQMHWYAPVQGYQPQVYEPGPGRMLPAPPVGAGQSINDVIMPVQINGLDETFNAINWLTSVVERGTGATAIEKGVPEQGEQTLGEIKVLVGNAQERALTMTKFYRGAWYETAVKWAALMQANPPPAATLYKTGPSGKVYAKKVTTADWKSDAGYLPEVASTSEQEAEQMKSIQQFQFVMQQFPNNAALRRIAQKRELQLLDLTPDEIKQVEDAQMEADRVEAEQAAMAAQPAPGAAPAAQAQPQESPVDMTEMSGLINELAT